jgi:ribonuclease HI
VFCNGS